MNYLIKLQFIDKLIKRCIKNFAKSLDLDGKFLREITFEFKKITTNSS